MLILALQMYDDPSLELVGSPPPSSSRAASSAGNMFVYTGHSSYQYGQGRNSQYENELFGMDSGRSSAMSSRPPSGRQTNGFSSYAKSSKPPRTPKTPVNNRTQIINTKPRGSSGKKKKQNKHTPSYTDELLFGNTTPKPEDSIWESSFSYRGAAQTPVSSERSYKPQNYYTRNVNKPSQDRPPSGRQTPGTFQENGRVSRQDTQRSQVSSPTHSQQTATRRSGSLSNTPKKKNRNRHNPSYVDEMLFGSKLEEPSFAAPWDDGKSVKPHRFDMTDYKSRSEPQSSSRSTTSARPSTRQNNTSRPSSRQSVASSGRNSVVNGRPPTPNKKLFKQSYVDENLFGPKPVECNWDAPWEDPKDKYRKPLIYDSSDYKMTVDHGDVGRPKPRVKSSLHKSKSSSTSNLSKKPAWR